MPKKKIRNKTCYLCGKPATSEDHLPPKCLAPDIPDNKFFLLPACDNCNNSPSLEENRLRDIVAVGSAYYTPSANAMYQKMLRSFDYGQELRGKGVPSKDLKRLLNNIHIVLSPNGQKIAAVKLPQDVDYNKPLIKIAKGLHYLYAREVMPETRKPFVAWYDPIHPNDDIIKIANSLPIKGIIVKALRYFGGIDDQYSLWVLSFHHRVTVLISFDEDY